MALGALPYKSVFVSAANDGNGIAVVVIDIKDANNVTKGNNVRVTFDGTRTLGEAVREAIEQQMVADATKIQAATAVVNAVRVG